MPTAVFGFNRLPDDGFIVRAGTTEFFIEAGSTGQAIEQLGAPEDGAFRLHRDDATFLLTGERVHDAMLQTCSVDLAAEPDTQVIYSRVAGVNAAICPQTIDARRVYRLWIDYASADYLWEQFVQIITELGGGVVGADCFYPTLTVCD